MVSIGCAQLRTKKKSDRPSPAKAAAVEYAISQAAFIRVTLQGFAEQLKQRPEAVKCLSLVFKARYESLQVQDAEHFQHMAGGM